jgi:hypothetical protein
MKRPRSEFETQSTLISKNKIALFGPWRDKLCEVFLLNIY